ncbi:MAG: YbaB/EbfC family nucleoid-associated protein [Buchnera aphidicola (Eriosoma harunire)]
MFNKNNLNQFMEQAKTMQENMEKIQKEMSSIEVTGESGAGLISVTINGSNYCKKIQIDPSLLLEKIDMIEDLIVAAFNDASRKINEAKKNKMASISSGIPLPTNFDITA